MKSVGIAVRNILIILLCPIWALPFVIYQTIEAKEVKAVCSGEIDLWYRIF